jgi:hypothetical protein
MDLIEKPALTEAETRGCFETTMRDALRVGLTSIQDAASFPKDIAFFQRHVLLLIYPLFWHALTSRRMADEGRLPVSRIIMRVLSVEYARVAIDQDLLNGLRCLR